MYNLIRDLLFKFDPELIHELSIGVIKLNPYWVDVMDKPKLVDGIYYRNPIGLGAGFDKGGELINSIHKLGFGFMEVGTVTPLPQEGNPKPRLFRDVISKSLINRMGFNNPGLSVIQRRLEKRRSDIIIGGNIGKGVNTSLDSAWKDYLLCFEGLKDLVDYITINISSPNTLNLRELQKEDYLKKILFELQSRNDKSIPIYVKISPDLVDVESLIEVITSSGINGVICNNTKSYVGGGLSGNLIKEDSIKMLENLKGLTNKTIIGSGGIIEVSDVKGRLEGGCDLVQLWTGFVWNGPFFVQQILKSI